MKTLHARLVVCLMALAVASIPLVHSSQDTPKPAPAANLTGQHDFDFQVGDWKVHHRVLKADRKTWSEFEGTCSVRKILDGFGNLEENVLHPPAGTYHAVGLRSYDPAAGLWSIWWLDGRSPQGPLDPPVKGSFENGVGNFYSDDMLNGKPIKTRYTWSHGAPTTAHWEQAYSTDGGKTWETNWTMEFRRVK